MWPYCSLLAKPEHAAPAAVSALPGLAAKRCRGQLLLPPSTCLADYRFVLLPTTEPAIALAT